MALKVDRRTKTNRQRKKAGSMERIIRSAKAAKKRCNEGSFRQKQSCNTCKSERILPQTTIKNQRWTMCIHVKLHRTIGRENKILFEALVDNCSQFKKKEK